MRRTVRDHLQRELTFTFPPRRVVSLCPSLTETLFALRSQAEIVGRTEYCVRPAARVGAAVTVGGPRSVDVAAVIALQPDLVIADKEENRREDVQELARHVPVFVISVTSYDEALGAIRDLGALTDTAQTAESMVSDISERFGQLRPVRPRTVIYLVWKKPYIAVGQNTYIDSLLSRCGLTNVFARGPGRYPKIDVDLLRALSPELILLPSEPYWFTDADAGELAATVPDSRAMLVDGQMFAWYGSRMLAAADYLSTLAGA